MVARSVGAALVLVTMGVGGFGPAPLGIAAASARGASLPRCRYSQLLAYASTGNGSFDAAGSHALPVLLANVSHTACTLGGFATLTLSNSSGEIRGIHVDHNRSGIFLAEQPRRVVLRPGAVATFGISFGDGYVPANDRPRSCVATRATFSLPVAERHGQSYEVAVDIDVCRSDRVVGLTPLEGGPVPREPPNT